MHSIHFIFLKIDLSFPFFFRWHLITIGIIPPKRPFAYTQITSYVDGHQKIGATIKFGAFTEVFSLHIRFFQQLDECNSFDLPLQPFIHCNIGVAYHKVRRTSASCDQKEPEKFQSSTTVDSAASRGMFPSLIERTFLPQIVSQVRRHSIFLAIIRLLTFLYSGSELFFVAITEHIVE